MKQVKRNKQGIDFKHIPIEEIEITFGIHSGKKLKDIPTSYINYGYCKFTNKKLRIWRYYFGKELVRRNISPPPNPLDNIGINKWNK
jgi:hypothetical protein